MSKSLGESKDYFGKNSFNVEELLAEGILNEEEVSQLKVKIDSIDFFQSLNNNNLLKFSISNLKKLEVYRNGLSPDSVKYARITTDISDGKSICELLENNIDVLRSHFDALNPEAKQLLQAQFGLLIDSKEKKKKEELDSSFEGIVINAFPNINTDGEIEDIYEYNKQQINICVADIAGLRGEEKSSTWSMSMLAHESAHAIDDIYCKLSTVGEFLEKAQTIASDDLNNNVITKMPQAASPFNQKLLANYFKDFAKDLKKMFGSKTITESIANWGRAIKGNHDAQIANKVPPLSLRPFQDRLTYIKGKALPSAASAPEAVALSPESVVPSSAGGKGAIIGSSVPTEILSFHVEEFFEQLKQLKIFSKEEGIEKSEKIKELVEGRKLLESPDQAEVIAREIVYEATSDFYNLLSKKSPELKPYIDIMREYESLQLDLAKSELRDLGLGEKRERETVLETGDTAAAASTNLTGNKRSRVQSMVDRLESRSTNTSAGSAVLSRGSRSRSQSPTR